MDKAYEMYLRTSRLDLDDYNVEVHEGLHITSMAGTWMAVVQGFGGLRVLNNMVHLSPRLPFAWKGFSFKIRFRGIILKVSAQKGKTIVENYSDKPITLRVFNTDVHINARGKAELADA
jgi:maltose phosphorylase